MTQPGEVRIRRAVLSVSDKTGIVDFAKGLAELGVELISTGGTAQALEAAGLEVRAIDDFTGFPEIMSGRVKTLHPKLYAGLLAPPRRPVAHGRGGGERDRVRRPRVREPLPVRGDRRPPRRGRRRGDREHRHRRPDDDPRGGEELQLLRGRGRAGVLRRGPAGAARIRRPPLARHAREPRGRGVRHHRPLRLGDRALVRRAARRLPARDHGRLREGDRPRLRREPAPARRLLRAGRRAHARALDGAPARRPRAVVQQRARPQLRAAC